MSKRIDKKKLKRQNETMSTSNTTSAAPVQSPVKAECEQIDFFIQYQDQEYLEKEVLDKIKEKLKAEGTELNASEKLSVYLKPEDQKAYYTYAGVNSSIDLK